MSIPGRQVNPSPSDSVLNPSDLEVINRLGIARQKLKEEIANMVISDEAVDGILTALIARGHCVTTGHRSYCWPYPIACACSLGFVRLQHTHDLMRSDITGAEVLKDDPSTGRREARFFEGPVFSQFILADDFNYAPPQVQAVLLQAMQEVKVTVFGKTYGLPRPFFVLAYTRPFKQEGIYPLSEEQLDCFMFEITNPTTQDDPVLSMLVYRNRDKPVLRVLTAAEVIQLQQIVLRLPVSDRVGMYALKLTRASWPDAEIAPGLTKTYVDRGAGWRGVHYLVLGARARAALDGELRVTCDHVRAIAPLVLRHRLILNARGSAEGITTDQIVQQLLQQVSEPRPEDYK